MHMWTIFYIQYKHAEREGIAIELQMSTYRDIGIDIELKMHLER